MTIKQLPRKDEEETFSLNSILTSTLLSPASPQIDISVYCAPCLCGYKIGCVDDISIRACGEMFEVSQIKSSENPATLLKSGK